MCLWSSLWNDRGMDMTSLCINWYQFNKEVIGRWVRLIVVLTSLENVGTSALYDVSQTGTKNKMGFFTFNFLVFSIWITRSILFYTNVPILGIPWQRIAKSKLSTNNMCKIFSIFKKTVESDLIFISIYEQKRFLFQIYW